MGVYVVVHVYLSFIRMYFLYCTLIIKSNIYILQHYHSGLYPFVALEEEHQHLHRRVKLMFGQT